MERRLDWILYVFKVYEIHKMLRFPGSRGGIIGIDQQWNDGIKSIYFCELWITYFYYYIYIYIYYLYIYILFIYIFRLHHNSPTSWSHQCLFWTFASCYRTTLTTPTPSAHVSDHKVWIIMKFLKTSLTVSPKMWPPRQGVLVLDRNHSMNLCVSMNFR